MRTPVCDFVRGYAASGTRRLHMPGHKGVGDIESLDITEISGADSLYEADGIIAESEGYASELFGARSFYSTEGSSLSIRAMLHLGATLARAEGKEPLILAGRNCHRVFLSAIALLDLRVEWLPSGGSYMSCPITAEGLCRKLDEMPEPPTALYLTAPDYLGFIPDIESIGRVCRERGILLLVDNAHGAYLKFLSPSRHPIDLGADMCADSAHKTLPVLTGGAYLHVSRALPGLDDGMVRSALSLFGSTSPSYLILASLDKVNPYLGGDYPRILTTFISKIADLKRKLSDIGYTCVGDEPMKITLAAKPYGYLGTELSELLLGHGIEPEFKDSDFLTLMPSPSDEGAIEHLFSALSAIERRDPIRQSAPDMLAAERVITVREAILSPSELLPLGECASRVLASADTACPPAVPILMPGERIDPAHLAILSYYGKTHLRVVK